MKPMELYDSAVWLVDTTAVPGVAVQLRHNWRDDAGPVTLLTTIRPAHCMRLNGK
jgi:hypothetical protein